MLEARRPGQTSAGSTIQEGSSQGQVEGSHSMAGMGAGMVPRLLVCYSSGVLSTKPAWGHLCWMLCRQGTGGLETECEVWKYGPTHTSQVSSAVWKRDFSLQKGALECSVVQHTSAVPLLGLSCPQWTVRAPLREVLSGQEFSVLIGHWGQMLTERGHLPPWGCPAICYRGLAPIRKCPGPLGGSTHPHNGEVDDQS